MTEFVSKRTPKTIAFKADHNSFDFNPRSGSLTLKFGRIPPTRGDAKTVDVELDAIIEIEPGLAPAFVAFMIKLGYALRMDFDAICKPGAGAEGVPRVTPGGGMLN